LYRFLGVRLTFWTSPFIVGDAGVIGESLGRLNGEDTSSRIVAGISTCVFKGGFWGRWYSCIRSWGKEESSNLSMNVYC
jgi:hypothetical protein